MALVLYPTNGYDSFVSLADATNYITKYTLQLDSWSAFDTTTQEALLRIAAQRLTSNSDELLFPITPIPDCIPIAQALMASQDGKYGFSSGLIYDDKGATKREKVSVIEVEYYDTKGNYSTTAPLIPPQLSGCLEAIGYYLAANISGLSQTILGRS